MNENDVDIDLQDDQRERLELLARLFQESMALVNMQAMNTENPGSVSDDDIQAAYVRVGQVLRDMHLSPADLEDIVAMIDDGEQDTARRILQDLMAAGELTPAPKLN